MNKINRKIEYSLMALKYMSSKVPGELTSAKEVAESFGTPFDATSRVMQIMAQKGLLRSEQGALGGYCLVKDLTKVTLNDLVSMIQGPTKIARCMHKQDPCEIQQSCNIVSPMTNLNHRLTEFYQSVTLRDLLFHRQSGSPQ